VVVVGVFFFFGTNFGHLVEKRNGSVHPQKMLLEQMAQSCHILRGKKGTEIIMLAKPCHSFALMALRIHA
jgi:hypothetical protein